ADAGPEVVGAEYSAQHVKDLRAALIDLRVVGDHLADVRQIVVDQRRGRVRLGVATGRSGARLHASDEGVAPVLVLLIQEREVSGKALAEPHVIPISFGGGVPEPLM